MTIAQALNAPSSASGPSGAGPPIVLVMGVSGSGKSTVGALLAQRLNVAFVDADSLHSPENIAKMSSGLALTDADRVDWLAAVSALVRQWRDRRQGGVMACSALKRRYRNEILGGGQDGRLVYLRAPKGVIRERLLHRTGHFMPAALLDSQFDALEEPLDDERAITIDVSGPPRLAVEALMAAVGADWTGSPGGPLGPPVPAQPKTSAGPTTEESRHVR